MDTVRDIVMEEPRNNFRYSEVEYVVFTKRAGMAGIS